MENSYLIGFYRKEKKIESIYSNNPFFYDSNLASQCKAVIVPLKLHTNKLPWKLTKDYTYVKGSLREILENRTFLVTKKEESSPFFALMYTKTNDLTMSRGGVLIEKIGREYCPVIVDIAGVEYIVEIKGCGCPLGGFPKIHSRQQSKSFNKVHLRLTGALEYTGAQEEYENLESIRKVMCETADGVIYRALGIVLFNYYLGNDCINLGLILRLSPSSIRFSFTRNEAIDAIKQNEFNTFVRNAGREAAMLLECDEPRIHRNMSWNNMVFVDGKTYVFTDYEEASPASHGHCGLDFIDHIYPHCFLLESYRQDYYEDFVQGLAGFSGKAKGVIARIKPKDISELNRVIIEDCFSLPIFRKRIQDELDYSFIDENISLVRNFMPEDYFQKDVKLWVSENLIPRISTKLKICEYYNIFAKRFGFENLISCIKLENKDTNLQTFFQQGIQKIEPDYFEILKPNISYSIKDLGKYVSSFSFESQFIEAPLNELMLDKIIRKITEIIDEASQYITSGKFNSPIDFATDLLNKRRSGSFENAVTVIFPFIVFVNVYLENEKMILNGVVKNKCNLNESELQLCEQSIIEVEKKLALLKEHPESYHNLLRDRDKLFKLYLRLPYMK